MKILSSERDYVDVRFSRDDLGMIHNIIQYPNDRPKMSKQGKAKWDFLKEALARLVYDKTHQTLQVQNENLNIIAREYGYKNTTP